MAVGSFASLSLDPPQVLFCAGKSSTSWPKIEAAGSFCVNILADDQEDVCRVFASKADDKFQELGWKRSAATGSPVIDGVLACIDCTIDRRRSTSGDHFIVVGPGARPGGRRTRAARWCSSAAATAASSPELCVPIYALGDAEPASTRTPTSIPTPSSSATSRSGPSRRSGRGRCCGATTAGSASASRTSIQDGSVIHTTALHARRSSATSASSATSSTSRAAPSRTAPSSATAPSCCTGRSCARAPWSDRTPSCPTGWRCRPGPWRSACPPTSGRATVTPGQFEEAVVSYVERGRRFRTELRRIS